MSTGEGGGNLKDKIFRQLSSNKQGFTLAEVLITLGIIGIVAAMTLPTLVNKYQKRTYITGLQKFYTQISQAMQTMKQQTNCEDMECMGFSGTLNDTWVENAKKLFKNTYQVMDFCYGTPNCEYEYFFVNKTSGGKTFTDKEFAFRTSDGFIIKLAPFTGNWSSLTVDINGPKNPNTIGRDIHLFRINKKGEVHPYYGYKYAHTQDGNFNQNLYWKTNPNLCNPSTTSGNGLYGCTARIIEEGWQMNY